MQACSGDPRYSMPIAYEMQVQLPDLGIVSLGESEAVSRLAWANLGHWRQRASLGSRMCKAFVIFLA